mgnify:CR=1 FL=1
MHLSRLSLRLLLFFGLAGIACVWLQLVGLSSAYCGSEPNCAIHEQSCRQEIGDRVVELDITPKPVAAMAELTFRISVSGESLSAAPVIDLGMPGMHMGPNRVNLEKVEDATYEGKGVIVRCPSGKRIWRATVTIPEAGQAEFIFDVIY